MYFSCLFFHTEKPESTNQKTRDATENGEKGIIEHDAFLMTLFLYSSDLGNMLKLYIENLQIFSSRVR